MSEMTPPSGARREAKQALEWRRQYGRGGTAVGVARARDISNGVNLSESTVRRMKAYFDRHDPDQKAEGFRYGERGYPSNGRIAWGLWGGDSGRAWAERKVASLNSRSYGQDSEKATIDVQGESRMDNIERRFISSVESAEKPDFLEIEERADPSTGVKNTYLVGYAAKFGEDSVLLGDFIERIEPSAFDIVKAGKDKNGKPLATRGLFNHDPNYLIARYPNTMKLTVDSKGLRYEMLLPECRKDLAEMVRRGDLRGSSFSFVVAQGGEKWSYEKGQSIRTVTAIKTLVDCGPVTFPAYDSSTVAVAQRSYQQFKKQRSKVMKPEVNFRDVFKSEIEKTKEFMEKRAGGGDCGRDSDGKFGSGNTCQVVGAGMGAASKSGNKKPSAAAKEIGVSKDQLASGLAEAGSGASHGELGGMTGFFIKAGNDLYSVASASVFGKFDGVAVGYNSGPLGVGADDSISVTPVDRGGIAKAEKMAKAVGASTVAIPVNDTDTASIAALNSSGYKLTPSPSGRQPKGIATYVKSGSTPDDSSSVLPSLGLSAAFGGIAGAAYQGTTSALIGGAIGGPAGALSAGAMGALTGFATGAAIGAATGLGVKGANYVGDKIGKNISPNTSKNTAHAASLAGAAIGTIALGLPGAVAGAAIGNLGTYTAGSFSKKDKKQDTAKRYDKLVEFFVERRAYCKNGKGNGQDNSCGPNGEKPLNANDPAAVKAFLDKMRAEHGVDINGKPVPQKQDTAKGGAKPSAPAEKPKTIEQVRLEAAGTWEEDSFPGNDGEGHGGFIPDAIRRVSTPVHGNFEVNTDDPRSVREAIEKMAEASGRTPEEFMAWKKLNGHIDKITPDDKARLFGGSQKNYVKKSKRSPNGGWGNAADNEEADHLASTLRANGISPGLLEHILRKASNETGESHKNLMYQALDLHSKNPKAFLGWARKHLDRQSGGGPSDRRSDDGCGRDGSGKFGSGNKCAGDGDGGGSSSGGGKSSGGGGSSSPKAYTTQAPKELEKKILAGENTSVSSIGEVNTVLESLAKMANAAENKGEKPPVYDLCVVSVPGTNLFCGENLGIDRANMPQAKGKPVAGSEADKLPRDKNGEVDGTSQMIDYMKKRGMAVGEPEQKPAASLKASQRNMQGEKVAGMMMAKDYDPGKDPIFVSKDGYVVDGHHRWAAVVGRDAKDGKLGDSQMNVRVIDAPIRDILQAANEFTSEFGIARKTVAASSGKSMEIKKGKLSKDDEGKAQKFIDDARKGQLERGGKDKGKSDDGGGVQTWSKGDDFPWTVKQVGGGEGHVQGQHPDGSKTKKYPFYGNDSSPAHKQVKDEIAAMKKEAKDKARGKK